jgi:sensor histidine kinase regulating citrate/malate metabolism
MINSIIDFCQNVNFEINLFQLVMGLSSLVLISVILLVVKKIVHIIKNERRIDERVRETSARIARVVTEIEETKPTIENVDQTIKEGEVPNSQEVFEKFPEQKKTRAMSTEERWAEFDKKRSIKNTA